MQLAIHNFIEARNAAGVGLDLRAWRGDKFDPASPHAHFNAIVDYDVTYDPYDGTYFISLDFSDGSSSGILFEEGYYGIYGTSEATFKPGPGTAIAAFVGYGLSTAPAALDTDVDDNQFFLSWAELEAIEYGYYAPPLSYFTLAGHDEIRGNNYRDIICGGGGNDLLFGAGGNDRIEGGTGRDKALGGAGSDSLLGDSGDDRLFGQAGNDLLRGGSGRDLLNGGGNNDMLFGDRGNDTLRGGIGRDALNGGTGNDQLFGDNGNDVMRGASGRDLLNGGRGNDRLSGGADHDTLIGGAGRDLLDGDGGRDRLIGGAGRDTFHFARGDGHDVIVDYDDRFDTIRIGAGARRFGQLDIDRDGSDTVIEFANVTIRLEDVRPGELDPGDFIL